ncbi:MAG: hypothetical protein IKR50_12235 [Prevotella sp.]|nr:hypothetical protein [Prevotella sp.]
MKTYQKPTTEMILVNVHQMVCASPGDKPTVGGTTDKESDLLSREAPRFDVWGDDEEE